jgi:hypothetical protein
MGEEECVPPSKRDKPEKYEPEYENSDKREVPKTLAPNKCPICLEVITNKCSTDNCRHEFCFECLHQWSAQHNYCPICRQVFQSVRYNIRSDTEFESFRVENHENVLRALLLNHKNFLRNQLVRTGEDNEEEIERLRQSLQFAEQRRQRIAEGITRIDAIHSQNNGEIRETLDDIRDNCLFEPIVENSVENDSLDDSDNESTTSEIVEQTIGRIVDIIRDSLAQIIAETFNEYRIYLNSIRSLPLNSTLGQSQRSQSHETEDQPNVNNNRDNNSSRNLLNNEFIVQEVRALMSQIFSETIPEAQESENENNEERNDNQND